MQRSPLTVQIILAVVAALLSETMNSATLSRMLLPLTIHAALSTRVHPIYYAIPVAVAASSNMIMPITLPLVVLHELFAGLVMKTALLSTLIISMNTTGQYIFHISPTVKGLNGTGPASRPQAPPY
ncbi:hypothetical protein HPB50_016798 [Hyalomma asiaticum]|uniref:Uncharacterized protein n=1 Tax=Hyalomma asiaticum TaxID=266040 RepID=A0ACB7SFY5_HYAAI|nr:hypothetical protein HPB50_016798 [Hyalomma asiaticum]